MPVTGILVVVGIAALITVALVFVTRYVPSERRASQNDVVGFVYAVVGVIYAVVLALVVVAAWSAQDEARTNTYSETNALLQIYWYGHSLPQPEHARIQQLDLQYTDTVLNNEWPLLARGQSSDQAWTLFLRLRSEITARQPTGAADVARYSQALDAVAQLGDARRQRLNEATDGLPALLWVTLVLGGAVTVGFAFMFGMSSLRAHLAVVFSVALLIGALLLVVYELSPPFSHAVHLEPTAFELAVTRMGEVS
jgi:hypothetical protein